MKKDIKYIKIVTLSIGYIIFLNAQTLIWERHYPFSSPQDMCCDSEGNVYITGGHEGMIYTMKISPSGDIIWQKKIDYHPSYSAEYGHGIVIDENRQKVYVIAQVQPSEGIWGLYLLCYNSETGDTIYGRYYLIYGGTEFPELPRDIDLYNNGQNLVVVGYAGDPYVQGSFATIYTFESENGNIIDHEGYWNDTWAWSVRTNPEGNFIVGGKRGNIPPSSLGFFVWKLDQSFNFIWQKSKTRMLQQGMYPTLEGCEELTIDQEHNIIVTGFLAENNDPWCHPHWWIIKYADGCSLIWEKKFPEPNDTAAGISIHHDIYNNLLCTGLKSTGENIVLYLSSSGDKIWQMIIPPNVVSILPRIRFNYSTETFFYLMGFKNVLPPNIDTLVLFKYSLPVNINEYKENKQNEKTEILLTKFFKGNIHLQFKEFLNNPIEIIIYNSCGKKIFSKTYFYSNSIIISDEEIKKGIYFLYVKTKGDENFKKFKLIKF